MVLLSKETVSFAFETDVLFWGLKDLLNPERCHLFISDIFITFTGEWKALGWYNEMNETTSWGNSFGDKTRGREQNLANF